jgi:hypothetical protein
MDIPGIWALVINLWHSASTAATHADLGVFNLSDEPTSWGSLPANEKNPTNKHDHNPRIVLTSRPKFRQIRPCPYWYSKWRVWVTKIRAEPEVARAFHQKNAGSDVKSAAIKGMGAVGAGALETLGHAGVGRGASAVIAAAGGVNGGGIGLFSGDEAGNFDVLEFNLLFHFASPLDI